MRMIMNKKENKNTEHYRRPMTAGYFAGTKKLFAVTALCVTTAMLLTACGSQSAQTPGTIAVTSTDSARNTITVNSSEKVSVIPDIAEIVYAVQTEASDAADCQKKNAEAVDQVIELLKGLGVEETSIQTSDYYMSPVYSYENNTQKLRGYEAATTLTVSDLPIDSLGNILTQSVREGINTVRSISYQSSQYDASYQEALTLAMASAKAKAEVLAQAGGCGLGSVAGVVENSNYSEARYTDNALSSAMRSAGNMKEELVVEDLSSIMPGEIEVEVNITVEYLIQ